MDKEDVNPINGDGANVALLGALQETIEILQEMKPTDRDNPQGRYVAILITDIEKAQAFAKTFLH